MKTIIGLFLHTFIMVLLMPFYMVAAVIQFNGTIIRNAWAYYCRHWILVKEILFGCTTHAMYAHIK